MRVILTVTSELHCGKRIWLLANQAIEVGRTEHASFVLEQDRLMSTVHFSLECDDSTCRLRDLDSERGTWVDGQPVREVLLRDADQIKAGSTTMTVHIEGDAKPGEGEDEKSPSAEQETPVLRRPFLHSVGGWHFQAIPKGWSPHPETGLQQSDGTRTGSCRVTEQVLPQGLVLETFAETLAANAEAAEAELLSHRPIDIQGAEEAFETVARFSHASNESVVQTHILAASSTAFGLATFTTTGEDDIKAQVDEIVSSLVFAQQI